MGFPNLRRKLLKRLPPSQKQTKTSPQSESTNPTAQPIPQSLPTPAVIRPILQPVPPRPPLPLYLPTSLHPYILRFILSRLRHAVEYVPRPSSLLYSVRPDYLATTLAGSVNSVYVSTWLTYSYDSLRKYRFGRGHFYLPGPWGSVSVSRGEGFGRVEIVPMRNIPDPKVYTKCTPRGQEGLAPVSDQSPNSLSTLDTRIAIPLHNAITRFLATRWAVVRGYEAMLYRVTPERQALGRDVLCATVEMWVVERDGTRHPWEVKRFDGPWRLEEGFGGVQEVFFDYEGVAWGGESDGFPELVR